MGWFRFIVCDDIVVCNIIICIFIWYDSFIIVYMFIGMFIYNDGFFFDIWNWDIIDSDVYNRVVFCGVFFFIYGYFNFCNDVYFVGIFFDFFFWRIFFFFVFLVIWIGLLFVFKVINSNYSGEEDYYG